MIEHISKYDVILFYLTKSDIDNFTKQYNKLLKIQTTDIKTLHAGIRTLDAGIKTRIRIEGFTKQQLIEILKDYILAIIKQILEIITELIIIKTPNYAIKVGKTHDMSISESNIYITTIDIINNTFTAKDVSNPHMPLHCTFDQLFILKKKKKVLFGNDPCKKLFETISSPPKK